MINIDSLKKRTREHVDAINSSCLDDKLKIVAINNAHCILRLAQATNDTEEANKKGVESQIVKDLATKKLKTGALITDEDICTYQIVSSGAAGEKKIQPQVNRYEDTKEGRFGNTLEEFFKRGFTRFQIDGASFPYYRVKDWTQKAAFMNWLGELAAEEGGDFAFELTLIEDGDEPDNSHPGCQPITFQMELYKGFRGQVCYRKVHAFSASNSPLTQEVCKRICTEECEDTLFEWFSACTSVKDGKLV